MDKPPCVLFPWSSWGWIIIVVVWLSCLSVLLAFALRRRFRGEPMRIIEFPSLTLIEQASMLTPITYLFVIVGQLSPIAILQRLLPFSVLFLPDVYIFTWFFLAEIIIGKPALTVHLAPMFLWWSWEYVAMVMYDIVLSTGVPSTPGEERVRLFPEYRELLYGIFAYFTVAFMAAALYRVHPWYLGQATLSPRDALYFSIITITTVGYGDIAPQNCLRLVAMWEALMSIFIIVVVISMIVGTIVSRIGSSPR